MAYRGRKLILIDLVSFTYKLKFHCYLLEKNMEEIMLSCQTLQRHLGMFWKLVSLLFLFSPLRLC